MKHKLLYIVEWIILGIGCYYFFNENIINGIAMVLISLSIRIEILDTEIKETIQPRDKYTKLDIRDSKGNKVKELK